MVNFAIVFGSAILGALGGSILAPEKLPVILGLAALCGAAGLAIAKTRKTKVSSR